VRAWLGAKDINPERELRWFETESPRHARAIFGKSLERAKGIEPSYAAWEAAVLPLNYARIQPDLAETARSAKRLGGA
jgi:hypothetical protein